VRESIAFFLSLSRSLFISNRDFFLEKEIFTNMTVMNHRHKQCHFLLLLLITVFSAALDGVSSETDVGGFDYGEALSKSLLYFEAQRSGRLPYNQRVTWRDHSGLTDGLEQGVCFLFKTLVILFFN